MKSSHRRRFFALLALLLFSLSSRVEAQFANLGMTVGVSTTNGIPVGGSVTYTMFLTNFTGIGHPAFLTNLFSGPVQITSATNLSGGALVVTNTISSNKVVFSLNLPPVSFPALAVTVTATNAGRFTNTITLVDVDFGAAVATNIISHPATNFSVSSDLAVAIFGPSAPVYSNDWTTYRVMVTNSGASVTNVMLTNSLPPSVGLLSTSPTNVPATNSMVIFNLGTLTNNASRTFTLQIQPTNAGVLAFSASVGGANLVDTNPTNNSATTNITILNFLPVTLTASNVTTTMTNNPQTGLFNQVVRLSNVGTNAIASARLIVTGVAALAPGLTNRLYNAVGTNNGNPFVVYGNTLNTNESVDLVLEYYTGFRRVISVQDSNYAAVAVSPGDPSGSTGTNGVFNITTNYFLPNGTFLIEFESIPGRTYTVIYNDTLGGTGLVAHPSVVAPANRVQWIDDGPPKTISRPQSASSRVYRVRLEP